MFQKEIEQITIGSDGMASHPYIGFSLVCQSIEVLGACFDEYDWEDRNLSELRFRLAIKKLFPQKIYGKYNSKKAKIDLYKNLRCPMVHQMRPGLRVGLSERKHQKTDQALRHMVVSKDQLIIIYEDFLDDFKSACACLIDMIARGELKTEKVLGHNISVPSDLD